MERAPSHKTFERAIETESVREMVNCDTVAAVTLLPHCREALEMASVEGKKASYVSLVDRMKTCLRLLPSAPRCKRRSLILRWGVMWG